jgi:hypothetical protein
MLLRLALSIFFTVVIISVLKWARAIVSVSHFHPSLIFAGNTAAYDTPLYKCRLQALATNVKPWVDVSDIGKHSSLSQ